MKITPECSKSVAMPPSFPCHTIHYNGNTTMEASEQPEKPRPRTSTKERNPLIDGLNNLILSFKNLVESLSQAEASLRTENKRLREAWDSLRNERDSLRQERDSLRDERNRLSTDNEKLRKELKDRPMYGQIKSTASNTATAGRGDHRRTGRGPEKLAQDK